jgi:hypothetical protein
MHCLTVARWRDHHLTRIFQKLGLATRVELAMRFAAPGPPDAPASTLETAATV